MTVVFLAVVARQYEGSDVVAVCSSREKALLSFRERCCADPDRPGRLDCSHDGHYVEAWAVDGSPAVEEVFEHTITDAWECARVGEGEGP